MTKKISRILGGLMALWLVGFLCFVLLHPEASFPWSNEITYAVLGITLIITVYMLIAPFAKK